MNNVKSKQNAHTITELGTANHKIRKLTTVTATTKTLAHALSDVASSISGGDIFIYSYSQTVKTINFKRN
jgi:hypothetical protein